MHFLTERTLCEQFANSIRDPYIRKELKKAFRKDPDVDFFVFRDDAILLSEEEENLSGAVAKRVTFSDKEPLSDKDQHRDELKPSRDQSSTASSINKLYWSNVLNERFSILYNNQTKEDTSF